MSLPEPVWASILKWSIWRRSDALVNQDQRSFDWSWTEAVQPSIMWRTHWTPGEAQKASIHRVDISSRFGSARGWPCKKATTKRSRVCCISSSLISWVPAPGGRRSGVISWWIYGRVQQQLVRRC